MGLNDLLLFSLLEQILPLGAKTFFLIQINLQQHSFLASDCFQSHSEVARQPLVPPLGARPRRRLGVGVRSETQMCCSRYYKGCMCSLSSQCSLILSQSHRGRRVVRGSSRVVVQVWLERAAPGRRNLSLVSGQLRNFGGISA